MERAEMLKIPVGETADLIHIKQNRRSGVGGEKMVGAGGVEPPTSASRTQRSNRTEPRPEQASRDYNRPLLI